MRLSVLVTILAAAFVSFAQTAKPAKSPAVKACEIESAHMRDALGNAIDERIKLETANKELQAQNTELARKYEELRSAAKDVLAYTQTLDGQYRNMLADFKFLSQAYDQAVEQRDRAVAANSTQQSQNAARQQRISNAIALYSAMPKSTFTPLPPPLVFAPVKNNSIHCTSTSAGGTTQTDCH
jgi:hypothetical protein